MRFKIEKKSGTVLTLVVLLIGVVGYFGVGSYNSNQQEKQIEIFQQGAQYGYEQAVIQAVQLAITCDKVPFRIENQTIDMIAVECLSLSPPIRDDLAGPDDSGESLDQGGLQ